MKVLCENCGKKFESDIDRFANYCKTCKKKLNIKRELICMNCGTKFKRNKLRVLEKSELNSRDFCDYFCLWTYYKKVDEGRK